ncbi:MAG: CoA-binding protein [Bacteroidales bacterium]|nr:CoA-binding protein [Bacteroidales bacterium]
MENILVIGASPNPLRYSYQAVKALLNRNFNVIPLGIRKGNIVNTKIISGKPQLNNINTIVLYINKQTQNSYNDYMLDLSPKRIVFNPGTENPELMKKAKEKGIDVVYDCALILIHSERF